jgi:Tripartite tricarboxylate transporter TctB family
LLQKRADLVFSFLILCIVIWMVWEARDWAFRAKLFPWTIGIPAIGLALLQMGFAIRNARRAAADRARSDLATAKVAVPAAHSGPPDPGDGDRAIVAAAVEEAFGAGSQAAEEDEVPPEVARRRSLEMSAWILGFALAVLLLGFKLSSGLASLAFLRFGAHERWKLAILISLGTYLFFYVAFDYALNIPFPPGLIAESLGLQSPDDYLMDPLMRLITRRKTRLTPGPRGDYAFGFPRRLRAGLPIQ